EIRWLCKPMHVRRAARPSGSLREQRHPEQLPHPAALGPTGSGRHWLRLRGHRTCGEVAPMSGANDLLANMPPDGDQVSPRVPDQVSRREPDAVGPREPDPITAELRERMERLPPGHPSSPYNDDGSPKPPLPDLSDYELPIPGDPDYRPEPSRAPEADQPAAAETPNYCSSDDEA